MKASIIHATDENFEAEVLSSPLPVLVDCWAEWCAPCKMIAPLLDEAADEYHERLKIVKLNIEDNPSTAAKYSIRAIPTLLLFRNGKVDATHVGALPKSQLHAFIEENL